MKCLSERVRLLRQHLDRTAARGPGPRAAPVLAEFLEASENGRALHVGEPLTRRRAGPLSRPAAEDALDTSSSFSRRARHLTGVEIPSRLGDGYFLRPAVLADVGTKVPCRIGDPPLSCIIPFVARRRRAGWPSEAPTGFRLVGRAMSCARSVSRREFARASPVNSTQRPHGAPFGGQDDRLRREMGCTRDTSIPR